MIGAQKAYLGRVLRLDPGTQQKLIELLTDQQMERFDQMHKRTSLGGADLYKIADETTRQMNQLHDLLGDEKLERLQAFEMSQTARYWIAQFSSRLAPEDRLKPDQEDQLIALKQEQFEMPFVTNASRRKLGIAAGQRTSRQSVQRDSARMNENSWRKRQVENPELEQKAAAFLTSTQLAELSRCHLEEQERLQRFVESARAQAGMDPKIPEQPEVVEETPTLIEAQLQVEVKLTVNRQPTTVTRTVRTGESFTFEAAQGLIVEVTPTMYEYDSIEVHTKYYERGLSGPRRLSDNGTSSVHSQQPDGSFGGGSSMGSVITGRRGYAVEAIISAKVL